jgi:hypothetical protein
VNGPRVALRSARTRGRWVDLLFYDDVLAVVPSAQDMPAIWAVEAVVALLLGPGMRRRRERREASPATLPRRTRLVPLADVRSVVVEPRPYGAARVTIDGRRYDMPDATAYREPWDRLLGPLLGDRLTVA